MIVIVDFGSQTTHLISRRLRQLKVQSKIVEPSDSVDKISTLRPSGIILSGGPASVYQKNAPTLDRKIFQLSIPILGICFGCMTAVKSLGGKVMAGKKEYGPAQLEIKIENDISRSLPKKSEVWMSHGDEIISLPKDFVIIGTTEKSPCAFIQNSKRNIFGVLFHPEVEHTKMGKKLLKNFIDICVAPKEYVERTVEEMIFEISQTVGQCFVIGAVSGGVDSTVAATLVAKAIGKRFIPIFVDNGLMRDGTREHLRRIFERHNAQPIIISAEKEMLKRLKGIIDPEEKRKTIGKFYIELFEKEMQKLKRKGKDVKFLMQGTIYSDVIESKGSKNASKIKSHHNVGGLPRNMKLKLLEPLRHLYKDEVRRLGRSLGLPEEFIMKQVFPGPGYAIRIRGEVTKDRLGKEKQADTIVLEELEKYGWLSKVYMSFPIMTGIKSTAVKGDGRFFGEVIALRIIQSSDIMTTAWTKLPYEILQKISSRIVNEVEGISRVVYDITTKPPATMEWE